MMRLRLGIIVKICALLVVATCLNGCGDTSRETVLPDQPAWQQSLEAEGYTIHLESDRIAMGVTDRLTITLEAVPAAKPVQELRIEPVDAEAWVVHPVERDSEPRSPDAPIRAKILLEPYISGSLATPIFRFTPIFEDGTVGASTVSEPFEVAVSSVLPEGDTEPAAAKGVVDPPAPPWWRRPFTVTTLAGAAVVIFVGAAMWWLTRRRHAPDPEMPSHAVALARLEELRSSGMLRPDSMDRFYLQLSEILRWYIERRYGLNAPDSTTEEFLQTARYSNAFAGNDLGLLERFLTHCDQVKFARARVGVDQGERSLETVRHFIERSSTTSALHKSEMEGVA